MCRIAAPACRKARSKANVMVARVVAMGDEIIDELDFRRAYLCQLSPGRMRANKGFVVAARKHDKAAR